MTVYGADADELERIARAFRDAADEIDGEANLMTTTFNRVTWLGDIAIGFASDWTGISIPKIGMSTSFLVDAAANLENQANEQRRASNAGGAGAWRAPMTDRQEKMHDKARADAEDVMYRTPAEQAEWWDSLTDEERHLLKEHSPDLLMLMDGLPQDVRDYAHGRYLSDAATRVVVARDSIEGGGWGGLDDFVSGGGGGGIERVLYADNSVDITFTVDGNASAGLVIAGVSITEGTSVTYHFESEEEANAFAARVVSDGLSALGTAPDNVVSITTTESIGGELRLGHLNSESSDYTQTTYNIDGSKTITTGWEVSETISDSFSVLAQDSQQHATATESSASVTIDSNGQPQTLTIVERNSEGTSSGIHGPWELRSTTGRAEEVTYELDLGDPVFTGHRDRIRAAAARGDAEAVRAIVEEVGGPKIYDQAKRTTTTYNNNGRDVNVDVGGGGAGASSNHDTMRDTEITAPQGSSRWRL